MFTVLVVLTEYLATKCPTLLRRFEEMRIGEVSEVSSRPVSPMTKRLADLGQSLPDMTA